MLATWLASKKAKSCQQNILQLHAEHTVTNQNNSFWKVFICVNKPIVPTNSNDYIGILLVLGDLM